MRCPKCGAVDDKVIDSRLSKDGSSIRRRRECLECGERFTTYEEVERSELRVVKRDGRHERFDWDKLLGGITKACEKRPISIETIENLAKDIVRDIQRTYHREIPSRVIGAKVVQALHDLDEVAYVRFASIYRQFQDVGEFISEIEAMDKRPKRDDSQPELFAEPSPARRARRSRRG